MKPSCQQTGVALAVTLFMLGLLTIIGVSAVMLGATHFRVAGNMQAEQEAEMAMQLAVEDFISVPLGSRPDAFNPPLDPDPTTITVNGHTISVDITQPRCTGYIETTCSGTTCSTLWELRAVAKDPVMGACLAYRWGISAPMPPSLCLTQPAPTNSLCP